MRICGDVRIIRWSNPVMTLVLVTAYRCISYISSTVHTIPSNQDRRYELKTRSDGAGEGL